MRRNFHGLGGRLLPALMLAGLAAPAVAVAQDEGIGMTPFTAIDGYAIYSSLDLGSSDVAVDDSDFGGGVRLRLGLGSLFFFQGGFQSVAIDKPDVRFEGGEFQAENTTFRLRESRIEGGLRHAFGESNRFIVHVSAGEYRPEIQFDVVGDNPQSLEENDDGLIYGGGVDVEVLPKLRLAASYHRADNLDNGEYFEVLGNVAYALTNSLGAFFEYRFAEFDFDNEAGGGQLDIDEFRFGLRFSFGSPPSEGLF